MIATLAPNPTIFAIIGGLEILIALAASYLILADRLPSAARRLVMTDIVFPDQQQETMAPATDHTISDGFSYSAPLPDFLQSIIDSLDGPEGKRGNEVGSTDVTPTEERG